MKNLKQFITEKFRLSKDCLNHVKPHYNYHPKDNELLSLVYKLIRERGTDADLNDIDTSNITNMSFLFHQYNFTGDISEWDVSNVREMESIFENSPFNGDISQWNVSNVWNMRRAFLASAFDGDISGWEPKKLKYANNIFDGCKLSKNLPEWYKSYLNECLLESQNELNGFVILKPEFLDHTDDFLVLLKNNGWDVVQKEKKKLSIETAKELYKMHKDKDFYDDLCKYMASDECLCCSCHKNCEDPIEDMKKIKDKVRKVWGKDEMKNGMHSSDSIENVDRESKLCLT